MWPFKARTTRELIEINRDQRAELIDGLQYRIVKERSILQRRLNCQEPDEERRPVRLRTRRTGKLYKVFQALGEDE